MVRCANCFEEYNEQLTLCPFCGYYEGMTDKTPNRLPHGAILNNRYIVGKCIGTGGFGITYKAWDTTLERVLAVKEYFPQNIATRIPGTREVILTAKKQREVYISGYNRMLDEARSVAKFNGENNIVNVFGYFEENNTAYMAMEYLTGMDLKDYIREKGGTLDIDECINIISATSVALEAVHKRKIVHRDIAPDNIRIDGDKITLIDFGAARFSDCKDPLDIVLKPGFAPPEQYDKVNNQGPWTDVYALGATMYMALTGVHPEESTNRKEEAKDNLPSPHELDENIPENLSNAVMKAMAVDRHMRFDNMAEFRKAIQGEKKILPLKKEKKRRKRKRFIGITAAMLALAAGYGIFNMNLQKQKEEETLPDAQITVWVRADSENAPSAAAVKSVALEFEKGYENVQVEVVAVPEADYEAALLASMESGEAPEVFESDGLSGACLTNAQEVADVLENLENDVYLYRYLLDNAQANKRLATGFVMPVLYVNHQEYTGKMDYKSIQKQADADLGTYRDMDGFFKYETAYFYSDSADYRKVSSHMGGLYSLVLPDGDIDCAYGMEWSLLECDEDRTKVGKKFMEFMYSSNSQDRLYLQQDNGQLPVSRVALNVYESTFPDFKNMFKRIKEFKIQ